MARKSPDPVKQQLEILKSLGFGFLESVEGQVDPKPEAASPAKASNRVSAKKAPVERPPLSPADLADAAWLEEPPLPLEERVAALERLAAEVGGCQACRLCNSRTNVVPGEGNPMAELMFVGEGPGADEDQQGRPFVGRAGQLLTKIIEAMQFQREDVWIGNVVKCRPPGNRTPEADEMEICLPYLRRQIEIVRPKVIVTLGKTALIGLLPEYQKTGITKLRGSWLVYHGIPLMPTFHPAYLLRSPTQKRFVWEDMQSVMKVFGKSVPG